MGLIKPLIWFVLLVVVFGGLWMRLAPIDAQKWHIDPSKISTIDPKYQARLTMVFDAEIPLIDQALIDAFPRPLQLIAGDLQSGFASYITRSRIWGFPDAISIRIDGNRLVVFSRSIYGRFDWGMNKRRLDQLRANLLASGLAH